MKSRLWSQDEVDRLVSLYVNGYAAGEIAKMVARTEQSVRLKLLGLGYSSRRQVVGDPPLEKEETFSEACEQFADQSTYDEEAVEKARRELACAERRRQERAKVEEAKRMLLEDRILLEFRKHLCDLPRSLPLSPPPLAPEDKAALTGILIVSDVHLGQVVESAETDGFGRYDPAVSVARVRRLETEAARILRQRPVEKLLVLFGGDLVHGHLGHSLEDATLPIAQQVDLAVNLFFAFLCGLATCVPAVEVYGVPGNHGRWPGQRKMPTDARFSNLDTVVFNALAALCTHVEMSNVAFGDSLAARQVIDVGNFRLQLQHGDQIRGGAFATGGMSREVTNSTLRHVQAGRRHVDYYIMGDKHVSSTMSFGNFAFIVNGSFVGTDNFALNFVPAPPTQTLFFLHPQVGKCETCEIRLDLAELQVPLPYKLKPSLEELVLSYHHQHN